jgi:hypothetical protein
MHKLQDTINAVFGDVEQKPRLHLPSEAAIERDRRFVEATSKLKKLKQARLQARAALAGTCQLTSS